MTTMTDIHPGHATLRQLFPGEDGSFIRRQNTQALCAKVGTYSAHSPAMPSMVISEIKAWGKTVTPADAIKIANWINSI